ncbi:MAG: hypothetical protein HOP29_12700 [Phycisphaerales bacterium]|nr:hypothetical protein [Phycisphaerales bacterium]
MPTILALRMDEQVPQTGRMVAQRRRRPGSTRRAFTLIELVLSVTISTLLLGGIASAMLIASRAVPGNQDKMHDVVEGHEALAGITHELYTLLTVPDAQLHSMAFTVPDRTGDSLAETIRYAWSGTSGDPLTRRYNAGNTVNVLEDVYAFDIDYLTKAVTEAGPPQPTAGPEQVIMANSTPVNGQNGDLDSSLWHGQYFKPTFLLSPTPVSWQVTKVRIMATPKGSSVGQFLVQLRRPDASDLPSATILAQVTVNESLLPGTLGWYPVTFASPPTLLPTEGVCLVLQHVSDADSASVQYDRGPLTIPHSQRLQYNGAVWTQFATQALVYEAYATVTTDSASQQPVEYLLSVGVTAQVGADAGSKLWTGVTTVNVPKIVPP